MNALCSSGLSCLIRFLCAFLFAWGGGLLASGAANAAGLTAPPAAASLPVTPVAIFGTDERTDLPPDLETLEGKIGMLYEQSTQTLCTAFCVGRNIVATAAHCLFQPKGGKLPNLSEVTFRLNYGNTQLQTGIFGRHTPYTKHFIAVGTTAFNNEPPLSAPRDWALVKIEDPVCRFGVLKVEQRPVGELVQKSTENRIFQVAYHWDYKHWRLAYSRPCAVQRDYDEIQWRLIRKHFVDFDQLLLHKCDTGGASSGSPLLMMPEGGRAPVAIGINVGTYTRTRILLRKGQVVKKLTPDIIANTGVSATAFQHVISELENSTVISSHDSMIRLQSELASRGLYNGTLDGELGRATRNAIADFESRVGMKPTGLPTVSLLDRFGEERVHSGHMLSNAQGPVGPVLKPEAKPAGPVKAQQEPLLQQERATPPVQAQPLPPLPQPQPQQTQQPTKRDRFNPFGF
jgi:peptidoglycan hydrolase-like protein with peptidoglycan-binding domain